MYHVECGNAMLTSGAVIICERDIDALWQRPATIATSDKAAEQAGGWVKIEAGANVQRDMLKLLHCGM